jgi:hypothetical protein
MQDRTRIIKLDAGGKIVASDPEMAAAMVRAIVKAGKTHRVTAFTVRLTSLEIELDLPPAVVAGTGAEVLYLNETARQLALVVAGALQGAVPFRPAGGSI